MTLATETMLYVHKPAEINRCGKMGIVLDLATLIEDSIRVVGSAVIIKARHSDDSSDLRLNDYFYPISFSILVKTNKKTESERRRIFSFWKRESDASSLVTIGMSNLPENNFKGPYQEALTWTLQKIRETF